MSFPDQLSVPKLAALGLVLGLVAPAPASAVPPPGAAVSAATLPPARWIEHRVIAGDRIKEIAELYGVSPKELIEWNGLDADEPLIRAGQMLRIHTREKAVQRRRKLYRVRRGDSWRSIARRHDVEEWRLRKRWNRGKDDALMAGERLVVWVEVEPQEEAEEQAREQAREAAARDEERPEPTPEASALAAVVEQAEPAPTTVDGLLIVPVRGDSHSVGAPGRGRLRNGVALPHNPALYTIRKPENSYGSSHAIMHLQTAIAKFRASSGFAREIVIADMSRRRGGRFRPHSSHRSGRDVDIRLPLRGGLPAGTIPEQIDEVDWDAAWALIEALIETDQVTYIFLTRSRQRALRDAAVRAGQSEEALETLIQYPGRERTALVRHSSGHTKHFHVRFKCAPDEERCRD